jgi:hypothetical protein
VSSVINHFAIAVIDTGGEQSFSCEVHFLSFSFFRFPKYSRFFLFVKY